MSQEFESIIERATKASSIERHEVIQSLWSGYGEIVRYGINGSSMNSVVVKHVKLPQPSHHPRGWNTDMSHQRKLRSYEVETAWYRDWNALCDDSCRTPHCLELDTLEEQVVMVLEDLDDSGFPARKGSVTMNELTACLTWLANFHATFMGKKPEGLWESGTYWHLETRPDELRILEDKKLKAAAHALDQKLKDSPYQSFVHGDAKLANFCFSHDGTEVAAVDFQYVGGGCGMKDVAYFIGSCLYEEECERLEEELLHIYFSALKKALEEKQPELDAEDVVANWSNLYHVAWTDFHRFVKGWSPGHWKIHGYSERVAREVVANLS